MKTVSETLNQDGFLESLFESIPCGILIVDQDRRVRLVNNVLERSFGISMAEVYNMRGGEVLRCINSTKSTEGCGYAQECQQLKGDALKILRNLFD